MMWANFAILGVGGALIAVPIILHFLMQPKPKELVFPAMRFLKDTEQSNRSSMRIRHFLLLLMRCLLIGLAALALAGPAVAAGNFGTWLTLGGIGLSGLIVGSVLVLSFFRANKNWLLVGTLGALFFGHLIYGGWAASRLIGSESAQILGDDQAPVAALIVIDTSPRMDYVFDNETRLESAKEAGDFLIGQFPVDSQVCVMATDSDQPFFSVDVSAAVRRIEGLETNYSGSTIPKAVMDGLKILLKAPQERKEIYIVTDLTQASWAGENPKPLVKQLEKSEGIGVFVFDVGVENPVNLALTQLNLSEAEISETGRVSISSEIHRTGPTVQRTVKLIVEKQEPPKPVVRDGVSIYPESTFDIQSFTKEVQDDSSVPVKFTFSQPLNPGTYHGRLEIEGQDGLAIDDQRYFTFRVGQIKKALIVHPENINPRLMESSLAPKKLIEIGMAKYERTTVLQSDFAAMESYSEFDAVYLLDPEPISEKTWLSIEVFVQNGGGLAIFLGHNAADGGIAHESFTTPAAARILTGTLEQQWLNEEPDLFLSPKELSHPIFAPIRGIETNVLWNRFPVFIHWGIEPTDDEGLPTQTLLQFGNREPAVIERTIGNGRVLIMTTSITEYANVVGRRTWNDLFVGRPWPLFLLLEGISSYLFHGDTKSLNVGIGETAVFDNDLREYPESYQVFSPQSDKPPTRLNTVDGRVRYRFVDTPGQYRLKGVKDEHILLRGFSANLGSAVTDMTRLEPAKLDGFLGAGQYQLARQKDEIQRQQGTTRRGQEFYPLVVLMMLVVMAVEFLMSNRFYGS